MDPDSATAVLTGIGAGARCAEALPATRACTSAHSPTPSTAMAAVHNTRRNFRTVQRSADPMPKRNVKEPRENRWGGRISSEHLDQLPAEHDHVLPRQIVVHVIEHEALDLDLLPRVDHAHAVCGRDGKARVFFSVLDERQSTAGLESPANAPQHFLRVPEFVIHIN